LYNNFNLGVRRAHLTKDRELNNLQF